MGGGVLQAGQFSLPSPTPCPGAYVPRQWVQGTVRATHDVLRHPPQLGLPDADGVYLGCRLRASSRTVRSPLEGYPQPWSQGHAGRDEVGVWRALEADLEVDRTRRAGLHQGAAVQVQSHPRSGDERRAVEVEVCQVGKADGQHGEWAVMNLEVLQVRQTAR